MSAVMETERLLLRELTMEDAPALYGIFSDPETMRYYPAPFDMDKTIGWIEKNMARYRALGFGLWAVVSKDTQACIGDCGLTLQSIFGASVPEIGYHINKLYWNRGYGSRARLPAPCV